jgi:hypothetical protein
VGVDSTTLAKLKSLAVKIETVASGLGFWEAFAEELAETPNSSELVYPLIHGP